MASDLERVSPQQAAVLPWFISLHQVGILVPGMVLGRTLTGLCRQAEWLWASSCTSGSQENAQPLLGSIVIYTLSIHSPMIVLTVFSPKTPSESFNPSGPLHFTYVFPLSNFVFNYNQLYREKFKRPQKWEMGSSPQTGYSCVHFPTQHADWKAFGTATEKSFGSKRFLFKWGILLLSSSFLFTI